MSQIKLNNNLEIPFIAFGTYDSDPSRVTETVSKAIKVGFRHLDTATIYRNEEQVGQAINSSGQSRDRFFITSKLPVNGLRNEKVQFFIRRTLNKLKTNYLDLYLIHAPFAVKYKSEEDFWPVGEDGRLESDDADYVDTWKSLENLYKQGQVKAIGVSNFNERQLQRILDNCEIKPMVNQIEVHVYFQNEELVRFCKENDIQVAAFAPLASPTKFSSDYLLAENETVQKLAKKYQKSWAQICLRFLTQQGIIPVVSAENEVQMKENINCNTFDLEKVDLEELKKLDRKKRIFIFDYAPGVLDHAEYPFEASTFKI